MTKQFFIQLKSFSALIKRTVISSRARQRYCALMLGVLAVGGLYSFIYSRGIKAQVTEECCLDVEISYFGRMCAQSAFTISLNGSSTGATGISCSTFTQTPTASTKLILNKKYPFVAGSNICSTHVFFDVPPGYTMEINGEESTSINTADIPVPAPGAGDGTWQIVVKKSLRL